MQKLFFATLALAALLLAANRVFIEFVRRQIATDREMTFLREVVSPPAAGAADASFAALAEPVPFEEIDAFDEEAHSWSNMSSQFGGAGVAVFDANGDGRLDVYLCHDGQNWTRATDEDGVLGDEPRYQSNGLYLNQGNDAEGRPIFAPVSELVRANDTFVFEELLIEDYLEPRAGAGESTKRWGRSSNVALAADLNGDGRPDLLVGNEPKGIFWSHPKTQRVLWPMVEPLGRQARHSKLPLVALATTMIDYEPRQGIFEKRASARGEEPEGANSLYLNLGDRDGDGLPEWRDVARESGIEGFHATSGLAVADVDLDGDLDVYAVSSMDGDFWVGGADAATGYAGGTNELFINQLAESGELRFVERAAEMGVDGVYDEENPTPYFYRLRQIPFLPVEYSIALFAVEPFRPDYLVLDGQEAEHAQISWATVFQDVDLDGYPDVWVANDVGFLRLYLNQEGRRFVEREHARSGRAGSYMSLAPADLTGNLHEDLVAGNLGGGAMSHSAVSFDVQVALRPTFADALAFQQFMTDKTDLTHAIFDGADPSRELPHRVRHSAVLPPDASLTHNQRRHAPKSFTVTPFDPDTLDPYEFAWGMAALDVQNDGWPDLYYIGCLYSRGGGLFPITGTGPGRLLVNATRPGGELRLVDLTAEHHVFDIEELSYDKLESEGYVWRRAPTKNWHKRDVVRSTDRSTWSAQGPAVQEHVTNQDLIQAAENGRSVAAADLNGDGFEDLLLTNMGGYDSRSSRAVNLKVRIDGRPQVLPAPDNVHPVLTNFEPGRTRLFLNRYREGHWLKLRLFDGDPRGWNRDAIGARVIVNGRFLRVRRAGGGGYLGNVTGDLHFGLGTAVASELEIHWPDRARTVSRLELDGLFNGTAVVSKTEGLVAWHPAP